MLDEERRRLAHDLKTPLAAIVGYAELLRTRDDEEIRREAPLVIAEAAARLTAAIDELLALPAATRPDPEALDAPPARSRSQVLVVDDDPTVRRLLRSTLPADQFAVLEAGDGEDCLDLAGRVEPALVLLDWRMPGRSGGRTLAELKTRLPHLPVIVLTGDHDPAERELAEAVGADAFLTKPFSPLQLLETIERMLDEDADARPGALGGLAERDTHEPAELLGRVGALREQGDGPAA